MGSASSADAIRSISRWSATAIRPAAPGRKATEDFGSLTFNDEAQRARLPKDVYRALRRAVAQGEPLDASVADIIVELRSGRFANIAERSGRAQDAADGGGLETLRKDGYM